MMAPAIVKPKIDDNITDPHDRQPMPTKLIKEAPKLALDLLEITSFRRIK